MKPKVGSHDQQDARSLARLTKRKEEGSSY